MGRVFQLFKQAKAEDQSDPKVSVGNAIADIQTSNAELDRTIGTLSVYLRTVVGTIEKLIDGDDKARYKRLSEQTHEKLAIAALQLSQQAESLRSLSFDHARDS